MQTPILKVSDRKIVGKNKISKERRKGNIPAIIYSKGKETKLVFFKERELEKILFQYGSRIRLTLIHEEEQTQGMIKEIQRDNINNNLLHVDLQTVSV